MTNNSSGITSQNETRHAGYETTEKTVEGERADKTAVHELDDTSQEHVQQVRIDDLEFLGRIFCVFQPELVQYRKRSHVC